ncbi:cilia- and flagella-associated protein 44 isoform X2 [Ornithorhynchus anatinus]|uniref:cilia- and flagella-associated protein 44 isoform X2 n=1 Tax=Ornithorhynchus anatinus TaxID=9258 RepID=UPI0010A7CF7A|nr:cilia- and flagella-associated protein 44 isoform X2 [Ornithorhynchus anatinus]
MEEVDEQEPADWEQLESKQSREGESSLQNVSENGGREAEPKVVPEQPKPSPDSELLSEKPVKKISETFFYNYDQLRSVPSVTPHSGIPRDLLKLIHSFGYESSKRENLQLLDPETFLYVAGNQLVILNLKTKEQKYLRSTGGGGIGSIAVHPAKTHFAVAEKGRKPSIVIYEFPSLRPFRILRDGTEEAYACTDFNNSGSLLASVGSSPDYTLTVWNWTQEQPVLRTKGFSQEIFKVTFNPENGEQLTTSGSGHIKFWEMALTFTGLKLQGSLGRFGKTAVTDIAGYIELPDGKVLSGSEWGNMLLWEGGLIKVEFCRSGRKPCHTSPVNQIVMDDGEVVTVGADGYIRIWDFETIDTADIADDSGLLEIEPINELLVAKNVNLSSMVKIDDSSNSIWYAQDVQGAIWKLDLSFSNITQDPECLFSFHSGPIEGLAVSPLTYLMATTSRDCSVRIFDFASRCLLTQMRFRQGGTSVIWAPRVVNPKGGIIVVGFEDGVVRIMELFDPKGLAVFAGRGKVGEAEMRLMQAFKPHTAPVTALAYQRNGEILATGSKDQTIFFFVVEERYEPIGYIGVPGPVQQLQWTPPSHGDSKLMVLCENGYVLQVAAPALQEGNNLSSYEIKGLPSQCFHFLSIKSRILRDEEIERREKRRQEKEKEKEARRKLQEEQMEDLGGEMAEKGEAKEEEEEKEEPLPEIYIPKEPSPMLCGFYSSPGRFWLSLGGYDSGFLYHCEFPPLDATPQQHEPFSFLPVENTDDNPIRVISFSTSGLLMFCGMEDGAVRIFPLQDKSATLSSLGASWTLTVHDNDHGQVQNVFPSYDDRFLVTGGADSNIFVFTVLSDVDIEKEMRAKVPSPRKGLEGEKVAEDIEDPDAYSIEGARRKKEHDQLMKEVEEIKARKREELKTLQVEFQELLKQNATLPEHMQLHRAEFELDSRIREEIDRQTAENVRLVEKELAWEQEKHQIGLKKLQQRFRDGLEFDTVIVHAILSSHKISTYKLLRPSGQYYPPKRTRISERRQSKCEWKEKEGSGRRDSQKDSGLVIVLNEGVDGDRARKPLRPKTFGGVLVENQIEKMKKIIAKAEKAKLKISQRKKEWEELYRSQPGDDYEDPEDVQAIKEAQLNMGDFNLKTAPDFKVAEHMRINAARKEEELVTLEAMAHEKKMNMNKCILSLRDLKVAVVEEIQGLVQELKTIQAALPTPKRLPMPLIPELHSEEVPERKFQYNQQTLLDFKVKQEARDAQEAIPEVSDNTFGTFGAGFFSLPPRRESDMPKRDFIIRGARGSRGSRGLPEVIKVQVQEFEKVEQTEVEQEILKREEIRNLYLQEHLNRRIRELSVTFDAELRLLRHQKLKMDTQMKLTDLNHVVLFQELLLLKNFEKQENTLQERVNSLGREEQDMKWKLEDFLSEMEDKKLEMTRLQDQEKALYASFQASLGENNSFASFLTKVLKKKIKRVKKKETEGDAGDEGESEEESDQDSSLESSEDESGSEDEVFDDSVCPQNCDVALFEMALQFREKRLDIEEALAEEKKLLDNLKKEYDMLAKKVKVVGNSLAVAEEDLEAYQLEKQQRLNELPVVIPLKLHQIECVVNGEVPSDLSNALVFSNLSLERLQDRITQLHQENLEQRNRNQQSRARRKQLVREKKEMAKKIAKMEEMVHEFMVTKFGREVDLEALQTLSVNTTLEELKIKKMEKELENAKELREWEGKIAQVRLELMMKTKEHTQKLHRMNALCLEKQQLQDRLDTLQGEQGNTFQSFPRADLEGREGATQLIQEQAKKILALRKEIALLRRKDGFFLPPIQPLQ